MILGVKMIFIYTVVYELGNKQIFNYQIAAFKYFIKCFKI